MEFLSWIKSSLYSNFQPAAGRQEGVGIPLSPLPINHSNAINFIWLRNKTQPKGDMSDPLPEKYTRNLLETAHRNPDASVFLWTDENNWNKGTQQKLADLCNKKELPNLSLRSLRDIHEYTTSPVFAKTRKGFYDHTDPIWQKVDYARVMVLNHLLETTDAEQVFYADIDLIAPPISSPEVQDIMQRHGMVFTRNPQQSPGSGFLENGFMGFGRENADFVYGELVPMTRNAISNGMDGWHPMCQAAREKLGGGPGWLDAVTIRTIEID